MKWECLPALLQHERIGRLRYATVVLGKEVYHESSTCTAAALPKLHLALPSRAPRRQRAYHAGARVPGPCRCAAARTAPWTAPALGYCALVALKSLQGGALTRTQWWRAKPLPPNLTSARRWR